MSNPSACDFTQWLVCDNACLCAHNHTATAHFCDLDSLLKNKFPRWTVQRAEQEEMRFNHTLPIKRLFKVTPRVHRKTPACILALIRTMHIFTCLQVSLCRHITGSSHRSVYLGDLKHSWSKPQWRESGRGLCGTVTRHMKPPEYRNLGSVYCTRTCVFTCVCVCVYVSVCKN